MQEPSTLQSFSLTASIEAVKDSAGFESYHDFYRHMLEHLPQNSPQTRKRYASLVGKRFFPSLSLDNLLTRAWKAYHDDPLLVDLMRAFALEAEPTIARFVLDKISPLPAGRVVDHEAVRAFVRQVYGTVKRDSYDRLLFTLRQLGFLGRYSRQLVVQEISPPADAFLILLHDRLAETPRIVRMIEILDADWWRFLGLKAPQAVRQILRRAEDAGLIARYAVVDELEQVTTRFSRDVYVGRAMRL